MTEYRKQSDMELTSWSLWLNTAPNSVLQTSSQEAALFKLAPKLPQRFHRENLNDSQIEIGMRDTCSLIFILDFCIFNIKQSSPLVENAFPSLADVVLAQANIKPSDLFSTGITNPYLVFYNPNSLATPEAVVCNHFFHFLSCPHDRNVILLTKSIRTEHS